MMLSPPTDVLAQFGAEGAEVKALEISPRSHLAWIVSSSQGPIVVCMSRQSPSLGELRMMHRALAALSKALPDVAITVPIACKSGGTLFKRADGLRCWSYRFIEGDSASPLSRTHIEQLGQIAGTVHSSDCISPTAVVRTRPPTFSSGWLLKTVSNMANHLKTVRRTGSQFPCLREAAPFLVEEVGRALRSAPDRYRLCFIHGDLHRGNLLTDQERITGVLDFQSYSVDAPVVDLARIAVRQFPDLFSGNSATRNKFAGLVESYKHRNPLNTEDWMLFGSALMLDVVDSIWWTYYGGVKSGMPGSANSQIAAQLQLVHDLSVWPWLDFLEEHAL